MVLSAASFYFINDANKLVLNPIERMLEKVRLI
jgi:class 3 adenylate cyclase